MFILSIKKHSIFVWLSELDEQFYDWNENKKIKYVHIEI